MYLVSCSPDQKITFQLKKPGMGREKHTCEVKMFCPTSLSPPSASTTHCCSDSCLLPHCCHSLLFSPSVPGKKNKIFRPALLLKANSFGEKLICQILICFYWISAERDLQLMPKSNSTFFPPTARAKVHTELRANENFLSQILWRLKKVPYQGSDLMDKRKCFLSLLIGNNSSEKS